MPADTVDITLGNLGASTAQPLLPKYQNPPTFDPLTDNVLTFLTEFENQLHLTIGPVRSKCAYLELFLEI
jgi:hypothetical protein